MRHRRTVLGLGLLALALGLTACTGGSGSSSSSTGSAANSTDKPGGTLHVVQGTAPDSLDPQFSYTT
ncbi:MAG: hypothetical protein QOD31_36, partial [Pseudonocardiales bacterium]|nr:hypothetical protein [Pseudonocardiales bacterium]